MGALCTTTTRIIPFDINTSDPLAICQSCHTVATELQQPLRGSANYNQQFLCTSCGATWAGLKNLTPPDLPYLPLGSISMRALPKVAKHRDSLVLHRQHTDVISRNE